MFTISAGGQVYDRTSGSWVGANQGSVGDGVDRSASSDEVKVWRDANGIVGLEQLGGSSPAGSGPAARRVGASASTGPGNAGVSSGKGAGAGPGAGPLKQKVRPTVTQLMIGGDWWKSNPWFSDADEWTSRYGEGELAETLFFVTNVVADMAWNVPDLPRLADYLIADPGQYPTKPAAEQPGWDAISAPAFQMKAPW